MLRPVEVAVPFSPSVDEQGKAGPILSGVGPKQRLSHVALPFPPDDPIYGAKPDPDKTHPWVTLGAISVRGERGLLLFPDSYFMRLRHNPFHSYMSQRIVRHLTAAP